MKPLADCQLYTFVDTAYLNGRAPELVAQQLCDGGSDLIQLRAKNSTPAGISAMAEKILPITRRANVGLVINDHLEIARDLGAEFCHLGQEDFFDSGRKHISELKTKNSKLKIGLSTHSPEQAKRALAAGPDYIAIGPVFATGLGHSQRAGRGEGVRGISAKTLVSILQRELWRKKRPSGVDYICC
jgi:thiamine-phosphate pyrophosphorylase